MTSRSQLMSGLIVLVVAGVGFYAGSVNATKASAVPVYIDAPQKWIPFEATVSILHPGSRAIAGRFYRKSDGSTRIETGPAETTERLIAIQNVTNSRYYTRNKRAEWNVQPMILPPQGWKPIRYRKDMPGLFPYRGKIDLTQSKLNVNAEDGDLAYQTAGPGEVQLVIPRLNMFTILRQRVDGGRVEFSEFVFKDPNADLFLPPSGVKVNVIDEPGGIRPGKPLSDTTSGEPTQTCATCATPAAAPK